MYANQLSQLSAAEVQPLVAELDGFGYGALWFPEHEESFARASVLLGASDRIVIGTGMAIMHVRDAQAMAYGARTLADAWGDRFVLGIGVSHRDLPVAGRTYAFGPPVQEMRGYLAQMDAADERWHAFDVAAPPRVLGAHGPRMLQLAAEQAAGAFPYLGLVEHTRRARALMGAELFFATGQLTVLADSRAQARALAEDSVAGYFRREHYRNHVAACGFDAGDMAAPVSDRVFDALVAWGSGEQIAQRVLEQLDAGADQVVINIHPNRHPFDTELSYLPVAREVAAALEAHGLMAGARHDGRDVDLQPTV
jgi:probable F420-dependent oxidoreductase